MAHGLKAQDAAHPGPPLSLPEPRTVEVGAADAGSRTDRWLARTLSGSPNPLSRTRIQALLATGAIRRVGAPSGAGANASRPLEAATRLRAGDLVEIRLPPPTPSKLAPEPIDTDVVYEDGDIAVVNKPPHMVVHPGAGRSRGSLAAALAHRYGALSTIGGVERPGIVHRLDAGTSGLLVVAKNDAAHASLSRQFKNREVVKIYRALVIGAPRPAKGSLRGAIGRDPRNRKRMTVIATGRAARSDYEVVETIGGEETERGSLGGRCAIVRVHLFTGRTHQIRVHLSHAGWPVAGDSLYRGTTRAIALEAPLRDALGALERPALHSETIGFNHPSSGQAMRFTRPWPDDIERVVAMLRSLAVPPASGPGKRRRRPADRR